MSSSRSFYHRVLSGGTAVERLVRHFKISFPIGEGSVGVISSLQIADILERMNRLRSVELTLSGNLLFSGSRIWRALASQTSLCDLTLKYPYRYSLGSFLLPSSKELRNIRPLKTFHISTPRHYDTTVISAESDLGVILLNSRETLEELTLPTVAWDFPPFPNAPIDKGLIWPRVRSISTGTLEHSCHLDFNWAFPSARYLSTRGCLSTWNDSFNRPFLSRLESMEGLAHEFRSAFTSAAMKLRRVAY
ncbi:hypothetical protein BOTBODRAFT_34576 [Botryobasidium botryosum FD-172 SS1]|uniref:F-box domain-containing protein n=1 Tax=Botryobasidium botryosum (strain FD-172 SS1) TaxID=930990 RepID=A0A067MKA5_BOTB1|nr:hypothetical protein BOTBODRAFT_34576 [Botryobasidium botryosum FD-172 SS1]